MVRLMAKGWPVCIRFSRLTQGFFIMEKPAPVAVTIRKALSVPLLPATNERVPPKLSIFSLRIIERVMQTAAFSATQRRIDDQRCDRGQIAQFQKVHRHFEVPIKFPDLALEIAQTRARSLEPLVRPQNPDVMPHESPDFVPIMIDR